MEAWGSVAIWLIHSETVLVSLVVRGSAAWISTSAASHTCERPRGAGRGGHARAGAGPGNGGKSSKWRENRDRAGKPL